MIEKITDHVKFRPTSAPSLKGVGATYLDSSYGLMTYDAVRDKWLSDSVVTFSLGRSGNLSVGSSFRTTADIPTSASPIYLKDKMCLVGASGSTSAAEKFVINVDDIGGGSGATASVNYEDGAHNPTTAFSISSLNTSYNAGDKLDVYVFSSATGNIPDPALILFFRIER